MYIAGDPAKLKAKALLTKKKPVTNNMFDAHNFDLDINVDEIQVSHSPNFNSFLALASQNK